MVFLTLLRPSATDIGTKLNKNMFLLLSALDTQTNILYMSFPK